VDASTIADNNGLNLDKSGIKILVEGEKLPLYTANVKEPIVVSYLK